ncbi:Protein of unknown function (DUF581 [Striga hermonthica]|uniref:FLZ-type domain-containing protein n=1 Tax=Striga hermonthica TaxID=68872 RepID=A0A9N7NG29_STRHE|nr:Protein of unknown function (DUF581 [Striga hermonthica]
MPVKRSRAVNPSSCVDATVAFAAGGGASAKAMKIDGASPPPPTPTPSFTTGASPVRSGEPENARIGGFLERCHYCRKRIPQNSEVYMYRDLCAFCSTECRDSQIELDILTEKKP